MFCGKQLGLALALIIVSGGSLMVEAAEGPGSQLPNLYQQLSIHIQVYGPGFCPGRQSR